MSSSLRRSVGIIQNNFDDGPHLLASFLRRHNIGYSVYPMYVESTVLPGPDEFFRQHGGVCVLGGEASANDPVPYFAGVQELLRTAVSRDIPALGLCLGAQLLAKTLGARVARAPHFEFGWTPLLRSPAGGDERAAAAQARWLGSLADRPLVSFSWHEDAFELPPGCARLLHSTETPNQAFAVGPHLGLQFHVEIDNDKLVDWIATARRTLNPSQIASPVCQPFDALVDANGDCLPRSEQLAEQLFTQWIQGLGPVTVE